MSNPQPLDDKEPWQVRMLALAAWLDYEAGDLDTSTLTDAQLTTLCGETLRRIEQMRAELREPTNEKETR